MKYKKITNMLDNKPNHPSKFMSKKMGWNKCGTYKTNR